MLTVDNMKMDKSNFSAVIFECNLIQNPNQWWVDTGATRHVCSEKSMFSTYQKFDQKERLYMGNSAVSMIEGSGTVILKFTSGKTSNWMTCFTFQTYARIWSPAQCYQERIQNCVRIKQDGSVQSWNVYRKRISMWWPI